MGLCDDCRESADRSYREHGDERFPPGPCLACGGRTASGACLMMSLCPACAEKHRACPGCARGPDGNEVATGLEPAP